MKTLSQIREASGGKEAYMKFFNSLLKKFGVSSPSELKGKKKKDFFDALDKGWESDDPNDKNEKYEDPDNLDPDTTLNPDEDDSNDKNERYEDPDNLDPDTTVDGDEDQADKAVSQVTEKTKLKAGKGKITVDLDWDGSARDKKFAETKYKIKIKPNRYGAIISGDKAKVLAYVSGQDYDMDDEDIEDLMPELMQDYHEGTNYSDKDSLISEIYSRAQMKKAIGIARKSKGQYTKAYNAIEKIAKGLGDEHIIANALKKANEAHEVGTDKYKKHAKKVTPGEKESVDEANRFSRKLNKPSKHIYDLALNAIRRNNVIGKKDQDAYVDDVAGVSLTNKELELVKQAIQHESVNEATKLKAGKGKITVDINWDGSARDKKFGETKYKIKIKPTRTGALVTGDKAKVLAYLSGQDYGMDDEDIEDLMPEILMNYHEGVAVDRRTIGFKAALVRSEKAKKVREKSKLKKEKKKEQEVLDARYDYDGGVDTVLAAANKSIFGETAANSVASGNVDMAPNAGKKKKKSLTVIRRDTY